MATYCYSYTNGSLAMRVVAPDYVAQSGEYLSSPEPATQAALETVFTGYSERVKTLQAYANQKQNGLFSKGTVWTFNVAASGAAPIPCTTALDFSGTTSILEIAAWTQLNAGNPSATLPYSNVNFSPLTLTLAEAQSLVAQAGGAKMAAYATLNAVMGAISAGIITTTAQIDNPPTPLPAWPDPGAQ